MNKRDFDNICNRHLKLSNPFKHLLRKRDEGGSDKTKATRAERSRGKLVHNSMKQGTYRRKA